MFGVAGCFGSDPNVNSMYYGDAAPPATTGSAGTGGGGTSVTGPIKGSPYALFATATEGFQLNVYHEDATSGQTNLGDPASNATPSLTFDSSVGSPDPGSLKVVAPYTGANQYVDIQKSMTMSPMDWRGKTMHVRIKIASGNYPGGAQVYAITVPMQYKFGGTFTNVAKNNNWQEFTVNLDSPMTPITGYDPSQVIIVGVQLNTGNAGSGADTVTFNIDSFSIDPPIAGGGTAGSGGGGAGGTTGAGGATGAGGGGGASAGN
jgi:hypothetical protein